MSYRDYYEVLGVSRTASADDIQKAYKKAAKKYHPDVNKEATAEERFKEIQEAHDVLKDPKKRSLFDKYGSSWKAISEGRQPPPGAGNIPFDFSGFEGQFDPNDLGGFFEQFFGGQAPGRGPRGRPQKGQDLETSLELTVREAFAGGPKEIAFTNPLDNSIKRLTVTLPKGLREGKTIRLTGQGVPGRGGRAGDLLLTIAISEHDGWRLIGDDVEGPLIMTAPQAALGSSVEFETLDGKLKLKVPALSSSGRRIRLKERGFVKSDGTRGDLYAVVQIVMPTEMNDKVKALYEQIAAEAVAAPPAP